MAKVLEKYLSIKSLLKHKEYLRFENVHEGIKLIIRIKPIKKYIRCSVVVMYEYSYSKFSEQFCCPYFSENVFSKHLRSDVPLDTRHKSNVNKTLM